MYKQNYHGSIISKNVINITLFYAMAFPRFISDDSIVNFAL